MNKNRRIAKNTMLLYIRMMIVMFINLYTVRLVLKALGIEDYGIYNVIAGFVTTLSCLTSVLSISTQRFYSVAQGESELQAIFSTSVKNNFIIVLILLLLAETLGLWFVNNELVIPASRLIAANWVFQASLVSFVAVFLQIPFSASVIFHEDMGIFAVISLLDCFFKFVAVAILFFINVDNLVVYSVFLALISLVGLSLYILISRRKYKECRYSKPNNKQLRNHMLSFSGWTLLASVASICMYQANTILVNIFFGPIVNASRGIALQLNSILSAYSRVSYWQVRSPMNELYAEKCYNELNRLFNISNKFIYYLMLLICVPLAIEMDTILNLWLNHRDPQSIYFSRLIVVYGFILALNNPISFIVQATGKVKMYSIFVEVFTIACMPATYILFKIGYDASSTFYVMIVCVTLSHLSRLYCFKKLYPSYALRDYFVFFLGRAVIISVLVVSVSVFIHSQITSPIYRIISIVFTNIILVCSLAYIWGLTPTERQFVNREINNMKKRFF